MKYRPRRFGKRWSEGAPDYVLDCFDDKGDGERYTVMFGGEFIFHTTKEGPCGEGPDTYANTYVQYLGMNDCPTHPSHGISMWGELAAHQAAAYRYRVKHRRVRWLDLPQHIRDHVVARATE